MNRFDINTMDFNRSFETVMCIGWEKPKRICTIVCKDMLNRKVVATYEYSQIYDRYVCNHVVIYEGNRGYYVMWRGYATPDVPYSIVQDDVKWSCSSMFVTHNEHNIDEIVPEMPRKWCDWDKNTIDWFDRNWKLFCYL